MPVVASTRSRRRSSRANNLDTKKYILTLPRVVELLCKEGLAHIERHEPSFNRGRMLSRDATGVRRVESVARQNGINLNRTSLINLLPDRKKITRNPSIKRTLQGIKEMLDLWIIVDPEDPESRRIQFKSAGELADLHAATYDTLIDDETRLRGLLVDQISALNADELKRVEELVNELNSNELNGNEQEQERSIREQLDRLLANSEQMPVMRLAMILQSHLSKTDLSKLNFARDVVLSFLSDEIRADEVVATQRALDAIETLLNSIQVSDDLEALQALLKAIAATAQIPNEQESFDHDVQKLVNYCGFPVE